MKFILLSDCRCGGTAIRRQLIQRGFGIPDCEPLWEPFIEPSAVDPMIYLGHEGVHLQRYQVEELDLWNRLAALPIMVINLYRLDTEAEYESLVAALDSGVWEGHQRRRQATYTQEAYQGQRDEWLAAREKTRVVFHAHPLLDITYEEFDHDNEGTVTKIETFIRNPAWPL